MHYRKNKIHKSLFLTILTFIVIILSSIDTYSQEVKTYNEAVIYADRNFKNSQWLDAKAYYQQALKLKPGDSYAQSQINNIVNKMKALMEAEDIYYDIIDHADELYEQNKIDEAISQYNKALEIIPQDEYATTKLHEINDFRIKEKDKIDNFNTAMETGKIYLADGKYDQAVSSFMDAAGLFPDNETPLKLIEQAKEQKTEYLRKEANFNDLITEAERYILTQNYIEALNIFQRADSVLPENTTAKAKIKETETLANKQRSYNRSLKEADEYYISRDFISAKDKYKEAITIWSDKTYPVDMISKIDIALNEGKKDLDNNYLKYVASGDSLLVLKEYDKAKGEYNLALNLKPNEKYPKQKLSEIEVVFAERALAFENDYKQIIASADSAFNTKSYALAKEKYNKALDVKPEDQYPQTKIGDINNILAKVAIQNELNSKYDQLIQQADLLFSSKDFETSIEIYNEALALKPEETYPTDQIALLNKTMQNIEKQKEIDAEYDKLTQSALALFTAKNFTDARSTYTSASELKPYELFPKQQISLIDSLVVEEQRLAELKKQYNDLVTKGDEAVNATNYDDALVYYNQAVALMPMEKIAADKKSKTENTIAEIKRKEELQKNYDLTIANADEMLKNERFELAKVEYQKALALKAGEKYPSDQIKLVDIELEKLAAEKEERFALAVSAGDSLLEEGNYKQALTSYNTAVSIKDSEAYPKQKITECESLIEEQRQRMMARYTVVIADADKYYKSRIYDKAIAKYNEASKMLPDEAYPSDMVNKITKFIEENAIVDIIKSSDTIAMKTTDKYTFEPVKINVRKSNYIFMRAHSIDGKPCKLIISYGSDKGKTGGFVIQITEGTNFNDYISRVGNQYKWFSEDNNWITIYAENGDVEVSLLRISSGN